MENKLSTENEENIVPEGFTISMAVFDMLPVLCFFGTLITIYTDFKSVLFLVGSLLVFLGGFGKASWKLVIALFHKNVYFLNRQMHYTMPAGWVIILVSLFIDRKKADFAGFFKGLITFPSIIFVIIAAAAIAMMVHFARHADQYNAKSNWKEQITNLIAQGAVWLAVLG